MSLHLRSFSHLSVSVNLLPDQGSQSGLQSSCGQPQSWMFQPSPALQNQLLGELSSPLPSLFQTPDILDTRKNQLSWHESVILIVTLATAMMFQRSADPERPWDFVVKDVMANLCHRILTRVGPYISPIVFASVGILAGGGSMSFRSYTEHTFSFECNGRDYDIAMTLEGEDWRRDDITNIRRPIIALFKALLKNEEITDNAQKAVVGSMLEDLQDSAADLTPIFRTVN